jgi:hypothetical protein
MGLLAVPLLLIAGCSTGGSSLTPTTSASPSPSPTPRPTPSPTPSPTPPPPTPTPTPEPPPPAPETDPLTGGAVVVGPVIGVKIDNTSAGLPQYGLSSADVVYVEQVEGGLTRILALFHTNLPTEAGPVRSVRTTDAELLPTYGSPVLAFSGGAGGPIDALNATPVHGVSEEGGSAGFIRSDAARSPYNLHVNVQEVATSNGDLAPAKNPGFVFAAGDPRVDAGAPASSITVHYQAATADFRYGDGHYDVVRDGQSEYDAGGGLLTADNVLIQNVQIEEDGTVDSVGSPSYLSKTVGSGTFTLYRDGHAISGNWTRSAPDQPTQFLDAAGAPVPFKPGKTWVALVPPTASVDVS